GRAAYPIPGTFAPQPSSPRRPPDSNAPLPHGCPPIPHPRTVLHFIHLPKTRPTLYSRGPDPLPALHSTSPLPCIPPSRVQPASAPSTGPTPASMSPLSPSCRSTPFPTPSPGPPCRKSASPATSPALAPRDPPRIDASMLRVPVPEEPSERKSLGPITLSGVP